MKRAGLLAVVLSVVLVPNAQGRHARPEHPTTRETRHVANLYLATVQGNGYTYRYKILRCKGRLARSPRWMPLTGVHAYCRTRQWYIDSRSLDIIDEVLEVDWVQRRGGCYFEGWTWLDWTDAGIPNHTERVRAPCPKRMHAREQRVRERRP